MSLSKIRRNTFLFFVILLLLPSTTWCQIQITENDFYDYPTSPENKLTGNYKQFTTSAKFPHWSDSSNNKIDVVESGIIRLSGIEGTNTLDILVLAIAQPIDHGGGIWVKEYIPVPQSLKGKIKEDIKTGSTLDADESFDPLSVLIVTWSNVEFYSGRKSSFQVLLVTNQTRTIAIIKVAKITIPTWKLNFYPELDARFAYEGGTKFQRSRFLQIAGRGNTISGIVVKSGNQYTHQAAVEYSNSGVNGRWILDLTADPNGDLKNATNKLITVPEGVIVPNVNDTNIGVAGRFVFDTVTLDGSQITKPGDNNEVNVILSKKDKDTRYQTLNTNVREWLETVFIQSSNSTPLQIIIINYKAGSLVVNYSVEIPNDACKDRARTECIADVETQVRSTTKNNPLTSQNMEGTLDETKTDFLDLDECAIDSERSDNLFCDTNAYCIEYTGEGGYACICKDGFEGDGKVGNCKIDKNKFGQMIPVIGGVGGGAIALIIFFIAVIWYVKRSERKRLRDRILEARRIVPKELHPKNRRVTTKDKPARSTRKVLIPARYGDSFDIYHRT